MTSKTGKMINCVICKREFYSSGWENKKRGKRKYCSFKCYAQARKKGIYKPYWLGKKRVEMTGEKNPSKRPEVRKKMSENRRGMIFTPEHKKNLSIARIGKCVGRDHPNWKGGRKIDPNGYVLIYVGKQQYQYEHILIIEKYLGRKLFPKEIIHHKNGIKTDNRIKNLQITTRKNHLTEFHPEIFEKTKTLFKGKHFSPETEFKKFSPKLST